MFHVSSGLADLGSNFIERVALYKEETQGLSLALRERHQILSEDVMFEASVN